MRRQPTLQTQNQNRLALDEIERLKADIRRFSDGSGLVITTPTTGSGPTDGPPTTPGAGVEPLPHVLYGSKHTRSLRVTAATGLDIDFEQGQEWVAGVFYSISAGSLTMADDDTNYVFVNTSGAVAVNTTGFPSNSTPLAEVVTAGGTITAVNDRRSYLLPGAGTSGSLHDADQIIDADTDTSIEVERGPDDDIIHLKAATVDVALIAVAGQWQLPITGSGAGILLGGDAQLYRGAANRVDLATGDSLHLVAGGIGVGVVNTTNNRVAVGPSGAFYMDGGADPLIAFAPNDFMRYVTGSNQLELRIAGAQVVIMTATQFVPLANQNAGFSLTADGTTTNIFFSGAADVIQYVDGTNLWNFQIGGGNKFIIDSAGRIHAPVAGSGAGLLLGGDVLLYRSAADILQTPDSVHIEGDLEIDGDLNHDGTNVGFYGTAPVAQQVGVAVTEAAIHAALVNLGLITA